ncbi:hypothetical protein ACFOUP_11235 [Belliella kenyensis]|uniref:Uncharacterized protein n=1 Tax=Belliella kenyensis TaxID=1472724 RepID=A0ABV8EKV2_9BACT|nr:hypothetical protein [Belliella kenyensis]MCH7403745.1 hypothetical protein [Belliella kenyensis]MDN3602466.1 hypothetical protein [Belliella kenyensis]
MTISLVFVLIYLTSCQSTKTTVSQYCKVCLGNDDGIIIDDVSSPLLSSMQNDELWGIVKSVFENEGFSNVFDRYELDYEFIKYNIKGIESQEDREQLVLKLGIKYILKPSVISARDSEGFMYDAIDPNAMKYPFPREIHPIPNKPGENQSILQYELIEISSGDIVYKVNFMNSDSGFITEDGDDYNFSTVMKTLRSGTKKATKFTIADCSCPKKKYIKRRKFWEKLGH